MRQDHNTLEIPLPILDYRTGHRDGIVLRKCDNVRPVGRQEKPFLSPVAAGGTVMSFTELLSIHRQRRQRRGEWSFDVEGAVPSSLDRLVGVAHYKDEPAKFDQIIIIDPDRGHSEITAGGFRYESRGPFARNDETRKTVSTQLGPELFLASATGALPDIPEPVLSIRDDQVIPLVLPGVPKIKIAYRGVAPLDDQAEDGSLKAGVYALRFAWILEDGSVGLPGPVRVVKLPSTYPVSSGSLDLYRYRLDFAVDTGDVGHLEDYWGGLLRGIVVSISERDRSIEVDTSSNPPGDPDVAKLSSVSPILNFPFYMVTEIPTNANPEGSFAVNAVLWTGSWADDDEKIPTYPLLEDDSITIGAAGACIAYNRRLFVGDVSVDWPTKPLSDQLLKPGDDILGSNKPFVALLDDPYPNINEAVTRTFQIQVAEGLTLASVGLSIEPDGTNDDWTVQYKYLHPQQGYQNDTNQLLNYADGLISNHPVATHVPTVLSGASRSWELIIATTQTQAVILNVKITATNDLGNPTTLEIPIEFA